ncbi:hypothetical protein JJB07_14725 [Tumebacillus sp. ITR2]|uniref:Uncharacterized protein n=1 Tax=Tumebacillus amylolyticus TaxID=2801339 RepID=A0ABS1JC96_9BACL|nr:hypothetical protein [Tumebacillus amylolyticus]MBL0387893.1 hypothetical protein [Tumebacillus amylolyticus]
MTLPKGFVSGGTLQSSSLTSKLEPAVYAHGKAIYWLRMLKEGMVPTKWAKQTQNGTKVNFAYPRTQEQFDDSERQLRSFVSEINEKYDLGIEFVKDGTSQKGGEGE